MLTAYQTESSKAKSSATDIRKRLAIRSKVSNEGAFRPRSMRLRKSTRNAKRFGKSLLRHPTTESNFLQMLSKLLP